jgi:hypothetical protein
MAVATFTADMCSMRAAIYKPLAQLLRLRALAALQKVLNGGSACSRRGTSRASGARHAAAMLASLFTPQGWEDTQNFAGSLDVLDNPVLAYERQSLEGLSDTIKIEWSCSGPQCMCVTPWRVHAQAVGNNFEDIKTRLAGYMTSEYEYDQLTVTWPTDKR